MGSALAERTGEVIEAAASRAHREMEREGVPELERAIEEHFVRLGKLATVAVADWVAGEPVDMASAAGEEFSRVFAQLAASRDVPLGEVVRRCRCWRESCERALREVAADGAAGEEALRRACESIPQGRRPRPRPDERDWSPIRSPCTRGSLSSPRSMRSVRRMRPTWAPGSSARRSTRASRTVA